MTLHSSLPGSQAFPHAFLHAGQMLRDDLEHGACQEYAQALCSMNTRPFPERIDALSKYPLKPYTRQKIDAAFADCENVSNPDISNPDIFNPDISMAPDFDPGCERLTEGEVLSILDQYPDNGEWIQNCLQRFCVAYDFSLGGNIVQDAGRLLTFLYRKISNWEADSFPLDCMCYLKNRYDWTFSSKAWSLREQLRQEALIIKTGWQTLLQMAKLQPLLFIINEMTPFDYFTSFLPQGAAFFSENKIKDDSPVLIYKGLKISSSEHRVSLKDTLEGKNLLKAMELARTLNRRPVLCDFSRRTFPRSFLRVARFAIEKDFGILPMGKLLDHGTDKIPQAKSVSGFPIIKGKNPLTLFDPWPVSDPEILKKMSPREKSFFCHPPLTKPWQDDRIGARVEKELDETGNYEVVSKPWVVPVMGGGWMRVDTLFKSRLRRFLV